MQKLQESAEDESVIPMKDAIIDEYQREIKAREDEYVKALTKQAEDIGNWIDYVHYGIDASSDELNKKIKFQYKRLVESYDKEMQAIEDSISLNCNSIIAMLFRSCK
jgi:hypothetical protein